MFEKEDEIESNVTVHYEDNSCEMIKKNELQSLQKKVKKVFYDIDKSGIDSQINKEDYEHEADDDIEGNESYNSNKIDKVTKLDFENDIC